MLRNMEFLQKFQPKVFQNPTFFYGPNKHVLHSKLQRFWGMRTWTPHNQACEVQQERKYFDKLIFLQKQTDFVS